MHMNEAQGSNGINETQFWTLFGDPSMLIRTDEPQLLNPIYDSDKTHLNRKTLSLLQSSLDRLEEVV